MERRPSLELKQSFGWAVFAARCANEPSVTSARVVASLLRAGSLAELCARAQVAPEHLIRAIDDPQALPFEECARRVHRDLAERGLELGSKEHLAGMQPLPFEPDVQRVMHAVFGQPAAERPTVISLELLLELMRANAELATRLADHGLTEQAMREALGEP